MSQEETQGKTRQQRREELRMQHALKRKLGSRSSLTHSEVMFLIQWEIEVARRNAMEDAFEALKGVEGVGPVMQERIQKALGIGGEADEEARE